MASLLDTSLLSWVTNPVFLFFGGIVPFLYFVPWQAKLGIGLLGAAVACGRQVVDFVKANPALVDTAMHTLAESWVYALVGLVAIFRIPQYVLAAAGGCAIILATTACAAVYGQHILPETQPTALAVAVAVISSSVVIAAVARRQHVCGAASTPGQQHGAPAAVYILAQPQQALPPGLRASAATHPAAGLQ